MKQILTLLAALAIVTPAAADGFDTIDERDMFVSIVDGRDLTRFGIRLNVTPDGRIVGRAFGRDVRGAWQWNSGYFCRSLYWGEKDLGPNCQAVRIDGRTMKFISDRGSGDFADFRIR